MGFQRWLISIINSSDRLQREEIFLFIFYSILANFICNLLDTYCIYGIVTRVPLELLLTLYQLFSRKCASSDYLILQQKRARVN